MIRLRVPGTLEYRDLGVRVVSAACKFVRSDDAAGVSGGSDAALKANAVDEFDNEVVSAFGEAFNNICLHGYRGVPPGDIEIDIEIGPGVITIRMKDTGRAFDPTTVPPPSLDASRESGMGVYIMSSFMELSYEAGPPNVLCLSKRREAKVSVESKST